MSEVTDRYYRITMFWLDWLETDDIESFEQGLVEFSADWEESFGMSPSEDPERFKMNTLDYLSGFIFDYGEYLDDAIGCEKVDRLQDALISLVKAIEQEIGP
jgi:hypothetical protein